MLDPKEQKKGGFGAFAAREREQRETHDAAADGSSRAPADGTPAADAAATPDADATGNPEPRHRRYFGAIL